MVLQAAIAAGDQGYRDLVAAIVENADAWRETLLVEAEKALLRLTTATKSARRDLNSAFGPLTMLGNYRTGLDEGAACPTLSSHEWSRGRASTRSLDSS
jgi:hypothetical protein